MKPIIGQRAALGLALLLAACLVMAQAAAGGGDDRAATHFVRFKWNAHTETFYGQIESKDDGCVKNRKVSAVFETKEPGTELVLAGDRAGASGKFEIKIKGGLPRKGKYYGYARGKESRCAGAFSKKLELKP